MTDSQPEDRTGFAPLVQPGIHMVNDDGKFRIAVSLANPTDESIQLRTMSTKLFSVTLQEQHGDELWRPATGAGQAVTHWTLEADSRVTAHYVVPNESIARQRAEEELKNHGDLLYDNPDDVTIIVGTEHPDREEYDSEITFQPAVEPDDVGIVQVTASLPTGNDYSNHVTRQFDLRTHPDRVLDDELPSETMDAIDNHF